MTQEPMPFLEAFPNLNLEPKVTELLAFVNVDRVTMSSSKNRLKVYITSEK